LKTTRSEIVVAGRIAAVKMCEDEAEVVGTSSKMGVDLKTIAIDLVGMDGR
jgi:hypothetical protein